MKDDDDQVDGDKDMEEDGEIDGDNKDDNKAKPARSLETPVPCPARVGIGFRSIGNKRK